MKKELEMKKTASITIFLICFLFCLFFANEFNELPAAEKKVNLVGTLGSADAPFDQLLMDVGIEFQLTGGLYAQLLANTQMDDENDYYYPYIIDSYSYHPSIALSFGSVYGFNAFGVYKAPISKKVRLFGKVGLTYLFYSKYYQDKDATVKLYRNGLGAGIGTGVEISLAQRFALVIGGSHELLFDRNSSTTTLNQEKHNTSWTKFYVGMVFCISRYVD